MEQFTVSQDYGGKSLVRVILAQYPALTATRVFQALRKKDIRLNGQRIHADCPVEAGDTVVLYINLDQPGQTPYTIVYEDPLLLIVHKKPGIAVQPEGSVQAKPRAESGDRDEDLLARIRRDLQEPSIELGHRLDRQTGGLLVLTRRPAAQAALRELQENGGIVKRYRCLVRGVPEAGSPVIGHDGQLMLEMTAWLEKDAGQSEVYIHDEKQPGDRPIVTRYRVLKTYAGAGPDGEAVADLEVELVTGRTHQIRAHFAHAGHPLLGDGKYGRNSYNRHFTTRGGGRLPHQQLYATQLSFLAMQKGPLAYLAGRTFSIDPEFDWVRPEAG